MSVDMRTCARVSMCVCVRVCACSLTHFQCVLRKWQTKAAWCERTQYGGLFFPPFPWSLIFLGGVTWRCFIMDPKKTAQERCKMQKDSNCTTKWNEKSERCRQNEEWRQEGRRGWGLDRKKKMIQECSLINASPPVNEFKKKKKVSGVVVSKSSTCPMSFSNGDMNIHWRVRWTLHLVHNKTTTSKNPTNLQFIESLMFLFQNRSTDNSRLAGQLLL